MATFNGMGGRFGPEYTFNPNNKIKVYESPSIKSEFQLITKESRRANFRIIKVTQQEKEFIRIATSKYIEERDEVVSEPLGWITIKDENNKFYFWIKMIDFH